MIYLAGFYLNDSTQMASLRDEGANWYMEARLITDPVLWNRFVERTATGHLCQTFEWADQGEDIALRSQALRVGVLDGAELVGAVLLLCNKQRGIPGALFYAPRGPVVADPDGPVLPILMRGAASFARQAGGYGIRIEPNMPDADPRWERAFVRLGFRPTNNVIYLRNTWILDIRPSDETLLAEMKMTWRYNIGLAQRRGVTVRPAVTEQDFLTFIQLLTETAQREQFYMYPTAVFRDMLAHYSPVAAERDNTALITLLLVEYQGEIAGATTVATFGKWAWSLHTGLSDKKTHRKQRPNYLLQWEAIRWAKAQGCEYFDFRNIPEILEPGQPMYGVYEFKRGFGGTFHRVMPTMDQALNPLVYFPYTWATNLRRTLRERKHSAVTVLPATPDSAGETPANDSEQA